MGAHGQISNFPAFDRLGKEYTYLKLREIGVIIYTYHIYREDPLSSALVISHRRRSREGYRKQRNLSSEYCFGT